jgi:hypothetical protein
MDVLGHWARHVCPPGHNLGVGYEEIDFLKRLKEARELRLSNQADRISDGASIRNSEYQHRHPDSVDGVKESGGPEL